MKPAFAMLSAPSRGCDRGVSGCGEEIAQIVLDVEKALAHAAPAGCGASGTSSLTRSSISNDLAGHGEAVPRADATRQIKALLGFAAIPNSAVSSFAMKA